jgi:hypothetical protein
MTLGATVRLLGKYRPGRRVTVYYDPAHPHLAVLEPGASFGGLVRVLISGAVVWGGLRVSTAVGSSLVPHRRSIACVAFICWLAS